MTSTPVCTPHKNTGVHRCFDTQVAHHTTTFPSGGVRCAVCTPLREEREIEETAGATHTAWCGGSVHTGVHGGVRSRLETLSTWD